HYHSLSNTDNVTDIDCYDAVSGWTNIVYRLDQALTPKPDNVSALYLTNETLIIRFQILQCFIKKIQLLLVGANALNTLGPLDIDNLQYIDEFYIIHWNIKLNDHSLYYLTVSAIGTYGTSSSNVTEINAYNVKDIIIERNEDIVCFVCITEVLNECQLIASTTTLIPQSIQTNGTCYSFTDNGTYTVYAHDIENGIKILTPAIVIQYTVDWIKPSDTENILSSTKELIIYQTSSDESILSMEPSLTTSAMLTTATNNIDYQSQSQIIIIILGGLLGLTTFAVLILSLAMIVILRKKGKAKSENSILHTQETPDENQGTFENQVATKEDPASYEMIRNEIPSTNVDKHSNYTSLIISTTDKSTVYDTPETRPQVSSCPVGGTLNDPLYI
uniref:Uncharacterized protein n=1 Tax=Amphimedon queenslandica TaxID=400682 RepID=A0A1X7UL07_AMPQE